MVVDAILEFEVIASRIWFFNFKSWFLTSKVCVVAKGRLRLWCDADARKMMLKDGGQKPLKVMARSC